MPTSSTHYDRTPRFNVCIERCVGAFFHARASLLREISIFGSVLGRFVSRMARSSVTTRYPGATAAARFSKPGVEPAVRDRRRLLPARLADPRPVDRAPDLDPGAQGGRHEGRPDQEPGLGARGRVVPAAGRRQPPPGARPLGGALGGSRLRSGVTASRAAEERARYGQSPAATEIPRRAPASRDHVSVETRTTWRGRPRAQMLRPR